MQQDEGPAHELARDRADQVAGRLTTESWTCSAPFGVPAVPLVKCSSAQLGVGGGDVVVVGLFREQRREAQRPGRRR